MTRIGVNTRLLLSGKLEGIGWFTFETLQRLTRSHPEVEFYFFFDRPFDTEFVFAENVTPVVLAPQARHPFLYFLWFEFSITAALKKYKIDLFLSPDGYLSLRTKVPSLPVIHDLNFEHFSKDLPPLTLKYYRYYFPKFAKRAARIATVSEFSKADIVEQYQIDPAKIDVVYNGINPKYHPISDLEKRRFREENTGDCPYFIFVGALHPRKNVQRLFAAFDLYKKQWPGPEKLLIVGKKYWFNKEVHRAWEDLSCKDDIIFTGRLFGPQLNQAISAAIAMVFVPYFEGFGIPILEAFACNTPVISANCTSMPEVAGQAAEYVDPYSVEQIAQAMHKVNSSAELQKQLVEKGRLQLQKFSWDKTAKALWSSIKMALNQK